MPDPHHFTFDLDAAISAQVLAALKTSPRVPLAKNVAPRESGIYALYHKRKLVYVGKASKGTTKSERSLRERLNEHVTKISGRQNIDPAELECQWLTMDSEWWVFAAEYALIAAALPPWNGSGYGSKTPGAGRPGTARVSQWNQLYPPKAGVKPDDEPDVEE